MSNEGMLAMIMGALMSMLVVVIIWYVVLVIAMWKMYAKAGEAGWKSLIPIYNTYIMYKLSWSPNMFWITLVLNVVGIILSAVGLSFVSLVCSLVVLVIGIIQLSKLSKAFGHGIGFTLGLLFLNPIFMLILGFGKDEYRGAQ